MRGEEAEYKAALQVWQSEVFAVIDSERSTVADLARAVGSHGSRGGAGGGGGGSGSGGASADPYANQVWIDRCGDDKRHMTALMRAAKGGRVDLVEALIDAHGAGVNVQAERSNFTALHVSTYEGKEGVVRALLARGADATLLNKYGETALKQAEERLRKFASATRRGILAMLQASSGK